MLYLYSMTKLNTKLQAIKLRRAGFSYSYIKEKLGVSKSSLTLWLKQVPFVANKIAINNILRAKNSLIVFQNNLRKTSEQEALALAQEDVGKMSKRDLSMFGLGIYTGEGSKTVCTRVVNSDPTIIKTCVAWFQKIYGLKKENFSVRLHLYPDRDIEKCQKYWANQTGIPLSQFQTSNIDRRTNKKSKNSGKLPFGTAHVTIRSRGNREYGILLMRRILASIDIMKEKAGLV